MGWWFLLLACSYARCTRSVSIGKQMSNVNVDVPLSTKDEGCEDWLLLFWLCVHFAHLSLLVPCSFSWLWNAFSCEQSHQPTMHTWLLSGHDSTWSQRHRTVDHWQVDLVLATGACSQDQQLPAPIGWQELWGNFQHWKRMSRKWCFTVRREVLQPWIKTWFGHRQVYHRLQLLQAFSGTDVWMSRSSLAMLDS